MDLRGSVLVLREQLRRHQKPPPSKSKESVARVPHRDIGDGADPRVVVIAQCQEPTGERFAVEEAAVTRPHASEVVQGGPRFRSPVPGSLFFHALQALVVVGELLHVRERDLPGQDRVVPGHIGLRIVGAMLVLDVHAVAELLEVEAAPIDPDLVAYPPGFLARRSSRLGHLAASRARLRKHPSASLVVGSHPTIVTLRATASGSRASRDERPTAVVALVVGFLDLRFGLLVRGR